MRRLPVLLALVTAVATGCGGTRGGETVDVAALFHREAVLENGAGTPAQANSELRGGPEAATSGPGDESGATAVDAQSTGGPRPATGATPAPAATGPGRGGAPKVTPAEAAGGSSSSSTDHASARSESRTPTPGRASGEGVAPPGPGGGGTPAADPAAVVEIGVIYEAQLTAGNSIGATKNTDAGDTKAQAQAVIDVVNNTGGIGGRRIRPVWFKNDVNSGAYDTRAQEACATFTEDHRVFAVVSTWLAPYRLADCLAQRRTPLVSEARQPYDEVSYAQLAPYLYMPGRMNGTRLNRVYVDELAAQGFFTGAVVGLVRFEGALYDRLANVVKTQVRAHKSSLTAEATVRTPSSTTDFGGATAEISNAILRFRTAGVTHVLFVENNGILPFFFLQEAESQGWRPRYGFNSEQGTETLEQYLPPAQLSRSLGVGWLPGADVNEAQESGVPNAEACDEIMRKAGIAYPERVAVQASRGYCDGFFFLQAAMAPTRPLTTEGLRTGAEALGSAFGSALTFTTRFLPGRYDGASSVRHLAYEADCGCFRYRDQPVAVN